MPIGTAYEDTVLAAMVAAFPTGHYRLFTDLPTKPDTELASDGGYAPAAHSPADWSVADGAATAAVSFGVASDAWADVAAYWAITDGSGALVYWDVLDDQIAVSEAGTLVPFTPSIYFRAEA